MSKNIHIKKFSSISMVFAGIFIAVFSFVSYFGFHYFEKVTTITEQCIISEEAARKMQQGSDILTEQVRLYVMTGQEKYLNGYFEEANVTKHRENAIEVLHQNFENIEQLKDIEEAMEESNYLMTKELYAMKLTAIALKVENIPAGLINVTIDENDLSLSDSQMIDKAQKLVSDDEYQLVKEQISSNVNSCLEQLLTIAKNKQNNTIDIFKDIYVKQAIAQFILLLFFIFENYIVHKSVITPLNIYNSSMKNNTIVPEIGAIELQSLAKTYNRVYKENKTNQELLHHEAEHDSLSNLLNRSMFNKILLTYQKGTTPFALMLLDVDYFKNFNDEFGHVMGDKIIQKVAEKLNEVFNETKFIFRIGGDEFAIIIPNVTDNDCGYISEKLNKLKQKLLNTDGNLPKVSMSIGITFKENNENEDEMFQNADKALYYVKAHGKSNYMFFENIKK